MPRMNEALGEAMLHAGQIDAFIGFLPPLEKSDLRSVHFMDVPLQATVSRDAALANRASISLSEFRGSRIACVSRRIEPRAFDYLTDILSEGQGAETLNLLEVDVTGSASNVQIAKEIEAGRVVGVNTPATVEFHARRLRSIAFAPPLRLPSRITWVPDRSPVLDLFTQGLSTFAPDLARPVVATGRAAQTPTST